MRTRNRIDQRFRYTRNANFQALDEYGCFVWVDNLKEEGGYRKALFSVPMMADGSAASFEEAGEITHPINQAFIDAANAALDPLHKFTAQDFEELQEVERASDGSPIL